MENDPPPSYNSVVGGANNSTTTTDNKDKGANELKTIENDDRTTLRQASDHQNALTPEQPRGLWQRICKTVEDFCLIIIQILD